MNYYYSKKNLQSKLCLVFFGLSFLLLINSNEFVFAQVSLQNINVTTDTSNIFFQNHLSLTNMTIQNDGLGIKFKDVSEYRKYSFFRMNSPDPYNLSFNGISDNLVNFTVNTNGLTDSKLDVSGSQISSAFLDNNSTANISWNGFVNTITLGSARFISIFDPNVISNSETIYTFDENFNQITVNSESSELSEVIIPNTVNDAKINYLPILITNPDSTKSVSIDKSLSIIKQSNSGNFMTYFPSDITITGSTSWTGVLNLPDIKSTSALNLGYGKETTSVIEIGQNSSTLFFDKPVRLLFEGKSGHEVGFRKGSENSLITTLCNSDNESSVTSQLLGTGECTITIGADLIVWTYHFTTFFTCVSDSSLTLTSTGGGNGDEISPLLPSREYLFWINDKGISADNPKGDSITVHTGEPIVFTIKLFDNSGPQNIQHVELYLDHKGGIIKNDLTETGIIYDKFSDLKILDPNDLIQHATVTTSHENSNANFTFEVLFAKEIKSSDVMFRVWDIERNPLNIYASDVFSVIIDNPLETIQSSTLSKINNDLTLFSNMFDQWAGYSTESISDKEFLFSIGIDGQHIPSWIKNNNAKWLKQKLISENDLIVALNNLKIRQIIN